MSLTNRDKAIIKDLNRFRVMDRNSIAELHFSDVKNPITAANTVLLRLLRDGHLQRTTSTSPYCYFGPDVQIKQNSAKLGHFLAILNTYKEMRNLGELETFLVEPKYLPKSKGAEPDCFAIMRKTAFFIEVQKTVYSEKQMAEKLDRYVDLFNSGIIAQPFPHVLILSEQRYTIDGNYPFRVFQAPTFNEFMESLKPKQPQQAPPIKSTSEGIRVIVK
jgi:hypothetical protein